MTALALAWSLPASAQVSEESLAQAARLGRLAVLAPRCGLRPGAWAADLHRAATAVAIGAVRSNDEVIEMAPGNTAAYAAVVQGERNALAELAQRQEATVCGELAHGSALADADELVSAFRGRPRGGSPMR